MNDRTGSRTEAQAQVGGLPKIGLDLLQRGGGLTDQPRSASIPAAVCNAQGRLGSICSAWSYASAART